VERERSERREVAAAPGARERPVQRLRGGAGGDAQHGPLGAVDVLPHHPRGEFARGVAVGDDEHLGHQPFTPLEAMPCTNTRWDSRKTMRVGSDAIRAPAITTFW